MFKKVIFSSLLSCLFATSCTTSNADLSSNELAQALQEAFSELLSEKEEIGKKVTINVLKPGSKNFHVSIKNGTCDDYAIVGVRVVKMAKELLIKTDAPFSEEQRGIVANVARRAYEGTMNTREKQGCTRK